jgi:hypothetical protein
VAADPTRRSLLAATAALPLLVTGCRGAAALGTPPEPAPDIARLRAAITAEEVMVASYRAAIRLLRDGGGAGEAAAGTTLAGLLTEHQEHLRQLRSRFIPGSPLAAGAAPLARSPAAHLPTGAAQAISFLGHAEDTASDWLLRQVPLVPPSLAQLFASISASEATHVPVLAAAGRAS